MRLLRLAWCRLRHDLELLMEEGHIWLQCPECGELTESPGWRWTVAPAISAKVLRFRRRLRG